MRVASSWTRITTSRRPGARLAARLRELERLAVAAELLGDDRAAQRELVVAEHALAGPEVAVDEVGGRAVAEPERERAARVERADVAGVFDQREVVRARRLDRARRAPRRAARPRATPRALVGGLGAARRAAW